MLDNKQNYCKKKIATLSRVYTECDTAILKNVQAKIEIDFCIAPIVNDQ